MSSLRLVPCGDRAMLCYLGDGIDPAVNDRVHALARTLRQMEHPAVVEVTPAFHTVLVEFDPVRIRPEPLEEMIRKAASHAVTEGTPASRIVEIPVCYGGEMGPDLEAVAAHTGLSPAEVVKRHTSGLYRLYCLGFSPGFPYLGGLDPALHTPRLAEPRVKVPGGSVGIGGEQTGIYPSPSPGGWQLIGRTPVRLFDPDRAEPALLQPGNQVRFVSVDTVQYAGLFKEERTERIAPTFEAGQTGLRILQPGMMTTLQDLGRRGYLKYGVPLAGAADFWSLMVGNWLLGNRARTAALEITMTGPEVEFTGPTAFAISGAPIPAELIPADGSHPRAVAGWTAVLASPGDRLRMGATTAGCRSYLCVAGGFDLPPVLGSLSEDLFAKIGPLGRPLRTGDWLPMGLPVQPPADLAGRTLPADAVPAFEGNLVVRATKGPQAHAFTAEAYAAFFGGEYRVGAQSDRQGLRLEGPKLTHRGQADIISEPMPPGAIQVPANGQPILLMGNRQSTGGYTKIGVALYNDLWTAAQLRPGDRIRFQEVDTAEAHAIAWQERRRLGQVRRYLEKEIGQIRAGTGNIRMLSTPAPAPGPAPTAVVTAPSGLAPVAPPTLVIAPAAVRTFRISIAGIEFMCEVEEVRE